MNFESFNSTFNELSEKYIEIRDIFDKDPSLEKLKN